MLVKKKDGWKAEDQFPFDGPRRLSVETYKHAGSLISRAAVNLYTEYGFSHAFGLGRGGDYSERVIVSADRATEKTIAAQHAKALEQLEAIAARARAHYEKFPPRKE